MPGTKTTRSRSGSLGVQHAAIAMALAMALGTWLQGHVPVGTRAQAAGAAVATLAILISSLGLGARARRSGTSIPWLAVTMQAIVLAVVALAVDLSPESVEALGAGRGTCVHVILRTSELVLPALAIGALGVALGFYADRGTAPATLAGLVLLAGGQAVGAKLAAEVSYDPSVINAIALTAVLLSFLVTGFALAFMLRRLAFVELSLVSLFYGYGVYFAVAIFTERLLRDFDVPQEQVLVALAFAPTAIGICLLAVGASVGFLLTGSGRFDASFSYELGVGMRYLRSETKSIQADTDAPGLWTMDVLSKLRRGPWTARLFTPVVVPVVFLGDFLTGRVLRRMIYIVRRPGASVGVILTISVTGVCLGVMALIVVLSVMSGFEGDLKGKILGAHAHVVINKTGDDFEEYVKVEETVSSLRGVVSASSFVLGEGMLTSDANIAGALIKGIDPKNEKATRILRSDVRRGSLDYLDHPEDIPGPRARWESGTSTTSLAGTATTPRDFAEPAARFPKRSRRVRPGVIVGRELARTLRVRVGDSVNIVSPMSEEIGPTGPQPKLRKFRVAGIFYSGMFEFDAKFAYIQMERAQKFFGLRGRATGVELRVDDVDDTPRIVAEIKRRVGGHPYKVKDWREMNKELFSALLLEKLAMFIILAFIVLVASFNIVSTLVMIVLEKGREIAILKSMGATEASIMKVFVVQGLVVGVGGAVLGLGLGVGICLLIEKFGIDLDPDIFYIDRLPVVMEWGEISVIAAAAIVITYLATIYPAMAAAQLNPVEGLRDD